MVFDDVNGITSKGKSFSAQPLIAWMFSLGLRLEGGVEPVSPLRRPDALARGGRVTAPGAWLV
jgi:hypothetical protein